MTIRELNGMEREAAASVLMQCCGSRGWVERVLAARPFTTADDLMSTADRAWARLDSTDRLAAFRSHPRIGERQLDRPGQSAQWSSEEQSGASRATEDTRQALARANREYERKFGYIFVVCATGRTADEMLSLLRARIDNEPDVELEIASEEQRRITRLRLQKLFD